MKNYFFLITLCIYCFNSHAQKINVKTHDKSIKNGYIIYADNNEPCPVSIKLDLNLKNLKSSKGNNKIFLLPAKTKNVELTILKSIKNGKYNYSYKTKYNYGNHFQDTYNADYEYSLPFEKGSTEKVSQGYNGSSTHLNQNALDFDMKDGTNILAARDGIVIRVIDQNKKSCHSKDCQKYNNFVTIYHDDGTFAEYTHIQQDGSLVKIGDKIKVGDIIAKSGDVGWSSGPHLHFVVYLQQIGGSKTLKTKFKVGDGRKSEYLLEKKSYKKDY